MPSLLDQLAEPPRPVGAPPPARPAVYRLVAGLVAALGIVLAKGKMLLLFGLKFGVTAWTMLVAAWVYSSQVGWPFAVLLVGLILVHEIGHGLAAGRVGVRVGAPVSIPFLGAFIALRDRPRDRWEDYVISAGGPLLGGLAALACLAIAEGTSGTAYALLHGCGWFALMLNLFNLAPIWILDGSKMLPLARLGDAAFGLGIVAMVLGVTAQLGRFNGMGAVVAAVCAWQLGAAAYRARRTRAPETLLERVQPVVARGPIAAEPELVPLRRRLFGAALYFGMVATYTAVLQLVEPALKR
jgi:Zn-dependent protease